MWLCGLLVTSAFRWCRGAAASAPSISASTSARGASASAHRRPHPAAQAMQNRQGPSTSSACSRGTHGTCACARAGSQRSRAGLVPAAVPRRYGSSTGLAQLSEACRCVMKKLPFAPNLEERAACYLSTVARAKGLRCGGGVLCCNTTGSQSLRRRAAAAHGRLAARRQTINQRWHITMLPHLCRAAPQCSHTAFRLMHCCTRMASAAGAAVALQRCAK